MPLPPGPPPPAQVRAAQRRRQPAPCATLRVRVHAQAGSAAAPCTTLFIAAMGPNVTEGELKDVFGPQVTAGAAPSAEPIAGMHDRARVQPGYRRLRLSHDKSGRGARSACVCCSQCLSQACAAVAFVDFADVAAASSALNSMQGKAPSHHCLRVPSVTTRLPRRAGMRLPSSGSSGIRIDFAKNPMGTPTHRDGPGAAWRFSRVVTRHSRAYFPCP
jgi:hypothetical protein